MIRTAVNGETCVVTMEGVDTVGEVLEQLSVHVQPRDVIVGVRIDGVGYDDDPAAKVRALPVAGIAEIDLQTRSPEAFAGEANDRLAAYLWAIQGKFHRTVECFAAARDAEAGLQRGGPGRTAPVRGRRQRLALGLRDIEDVDHLEEQPVRLAFVLGLHPARGQDRDTLLALAHVTPELLEPVVVARHLRRVRAGDANPLSDTSNACNNSKTSPRNTAA